MSQARIYQLTRSVKSSPGDSRSLVQLVRELERCGELPSCTSAILGLLGVDLLADMAREGYPGIVRPANSRAYAQAACQVLDPKGVHDLMAVIGQVVLCSLTSRERSRSEHILCRELGLKPRQLRRFLEGGRAPQLLVSEPASRATLRRLYFTGGVLPLPVRLRLTLETVAWASYNRLTIQTHNATVFALNAVLRRGAQALTGPAPLFQRVGTALMYRVAVESRPLVPVNPPRIQSRRKEAGTRQSLGGLVPCVHRGAGRWWFEILATGWRSSLDRIVRFRSCCVGRGFTIYAAACVALLRSRRLRSLPAPSFSAIDEALERLGVVRPEGVPSLLQHMVSTFSGEA